VVFFGSVALKNNKNNRLAYFLKILRAKHGQEKTSLSEINHILLGIFKVEIRIVMPSF